MSRNISVHGRNGTFDLHDLNISGSEELLFVDFLSARSNLKNPPTWWQGSKADILALLQEITAKVEAVGQEVSP